MADISDLRLFLHVQTGSADGDLRAWRDRYGIVPAWVKVFGAIHAREVRGVDGGIQTLWRDPAMSEDDRYILDGIEGGRRFVRDLRARAGGSFDGITAVEFMNEKTTFDNEDWIRRNNEAALGFVDECAHAGVRPVIHNAAFANPRPDLIHLLAPSVGQAIAAGGYFAVHGYGPKDLFDAAEWYVECYVRQLEKLAEAGVTVPPERVLITEFGHDYISDENYKAPSGPWRKLGIPAAQLWDEYTQYDQHLRARKIAGAFMYNVYGYGGDRFEIFPELRDWYGAMLNGARGTGGQPPTPPPAGDPTVVYATPGALYTAINLRSSPETANNIVGEAERGAPLRVIGTPSAGWYHIEIVQEQGGREARVRAYVSRSVVSRTPPG